MSYSPKSIQEKVKQEKLVELELLKAENVRKEELERIRRKTIADQRKADLQFYEDIGKPLLEAAIDGKTHRDLFRFDSYKYAPLVLAGDFDIYPEGDFEPTKCMVELPDDLELTIRRIYDDVYFDYKACDDNDNNWHRTLKEERILSGMSMFDGDNDINEIIRQLLDVQKVFKSNPPLNSLVTDTSFNLSNMQTEVEKLEALLVGYEDQLDKLELAPVVRISWADKYDEVEDVRYPFFSASFFYWLASDEGKTFTNEAFLAIKQSMASESSECTLEFRPLSDDPLDSEDRYLFFNDSELYCTIEPIQGMFECLGYQAKVVTSNNSNKLSLRIAWGKN